MKTRCWHEKNWHEKKKNRPGILFRFVLVSLGLAAGILFPGCLGSPLARQTLYRPGIYEGTGRGYRGPVHVQVELSSAGIEDIVITDHSEEPYPGGAAMEELLETVLESGTTDVDVISGASISSRAFLDAVDDALGQAQPGGQER